MTSNVNRTMQTCYCISQFAHNVIFYAARSIEHVRSAFCRQLGLPSAHVQLTIARDAEHKVSKTKRVCEDPKVRRRD